MRIEIDNIFYELHNWITMTSKIWMLSLFTVSKQWGGFTLYNSLSLHIDNKKDVDVVVTYLRISSPEKV